MVSESSPSPFHPSPFPFLSHPHAPPLFLNVLGEQMHQLWKLVLRAWSWGSRSRSPGGIWAGSRAASQCRNLRQDEWRDGTARVAHAGGLQQSPSQRTWLCKHAGSSPDGLSHTDVKGSCKNVPSVCTAGFPSTFYWDIGWGRGKGLPLASGAGTILLDQWLSRLGIPCSSDLLCYDVTGNLV